MASGMSFGVVEGEPEAGLAGLTVAEIEGHPFGQLRFTGAALGRWPMSGCSRRSCPARWSVSAATTPSTPPSTAREVPAEPLLFLKPSTSVIGPGTRSGCRLQSKQVEHEAELAVVIGAARRPPRRPRRRRRGPSSATPAPTT